MINTTDILSYIESLANSQLKESNLRDITSKIKEARKKVNDSKLYLALVGEFSSGKSTFINALLGFRLLKEAVMPTTACATYIQSGSKLLTIDVAFFDGEKFHATSSDFKAVANYLCSKYKREYKTLLSIIEDITSDQTIARTVKKLQITIPDAKIPKNIVLIDTPGFNPGAASVDNHYEITKYTVENIADAALVLTPQEQAMSATLIRFLKETLYRCLHRCSFVITKMDNLSAEFRTGTMEYVRQRIANDLKIATPHLTAQSAITMLPVKKIPLDKQTDWIYFQNEFKMFENTIWGTLQRNKEVVLKEHINVLVKDIVVLCSQKIKEKEASIKETKKFLENHKVESIQRVCEKMISQATSAIHTALNKMSVSFANAENNSIRKADIIIDEGAMSIVRFKSTMMPSICGVVEAEAKKQLKKINTELNRVVKQCVNTQVNNMQSVFSSHYDSFPALRPRESVPKADLIKFNTPKLSFSIAISKIEELEEKENKAAGIGAVAGGILGFLVGGPIGAAVGATLGGGGGAIANDQSAEMRLSAKPIVRNEISSFFSSLRIRVDNEMNRMKSRYSNLIENFSEDHIKRYGNAVNQLIAKHRDDMNFVDNQIKSLKSSLINLSAIQDEIEHELNILRIHN